MKLYIDDVNLEKIKGNWSFFPFAGVTSNPTILKKNGKQPIQILKEIRAFIGNDKNLMVQVTAEDAETMLREIDFIVEKLGIEHTVVKVPANKEGIKAIRESKSRNNNILLCATAVYSVGQGFLAAQVGADCVAPYINRIDNLSGDGIQVAKDIHDIIKAYGLSCEVLAASFKTTRQVVELAKYGISSATISLDVWEAFFKNEIVTSAIDTFNKDFETLVGEKSILACE